MPGAVGRWRFFLVLLLGSFGLVIAPMRGKSTAAKKPVTAQQPFAILSDRPLEGDLKYAVDIRWSSDHSVFLALKRRGVVEVDLDQQASSAKEMIAGEKSPGGLWLSWHLGATRENLVAAAPAFALTWRSLAVPARKEADFEFVTDLDARGERVAVLGARRDDAGKFSPDGAIAWMGSLSKGLSDLKPLLYDVGGPTAPNMNRCALCFLGATRFLADGSLLVAPGVQPGISLFDPQGKLVKTVDTVALGLDSDCSGISDAQRSKMAQRTTERMAWVNGRHILDDVLPLPGGPGLLIRTVEKGQVRWSLKILHPDGSVTAREVPVQAQTPFAHLKGDVRRDRVALLLWEYAPDGGPEGAPTPHLVQLTLP